LPVFLVSVVRPPFDFYIQLHIVDTWMYGHKYI